MLKSLARIGLRWRCARLWYHMAMALQELCSEICNIDSSYEHLLFPFFGRWQHLVSDGFCTSGDAS